MNEPEARPAPATPAELKGVARAALRSADRCIRIDQLQEALRLIELAAARLKQISPR